MSYDSDFDSLLPAREQDYSEQGYSIEPPEDSSGDDCKIRCDFKYEFTAVDVGTEANVGEACQQVADTALTWVSLEQTPNDVWTRLFGVHAGKAHDEALAILSKPMEPSSFEYKPGSLEYKDGVVTCTGSITVNDPSPEPFVVSGASGATTANLSSIASTLSNQISNSSLHHYPIGSILPKP